MIYLVDSARCLNNHNVIDETEDHVLGVSSVARIQRAREFGMGFFFFGGGLIFGPGIFVVFVGNPRDFFLRFAFYPYTIIPITWNP